MNHRAEPPAASHHAARAGLPLAALAALALGIALARHGLRLATELSPATQVDAVVVLVVTLGGALLAGWVGLHLLVASICVVGAACGQRWRTGERLVAEHAPILVRRGLAAALGASIGLGGLATVSANEQVPFADAQPGSGQGTSISLGIDLHPTVTVTTHPGGVEDPLDLGWTPTPGVEVVSGPGSGEQPGPAPADGEPGGDEPANTPSDDDESDDGAPDGDATDGDATEGDATEDDGDPPGEEASEPEERRYVVASGDSLWSITDDLLGDADDAEIATAWQELYESNRDVVGTDPDLIHPGQALVVPAVLEELT